MDLKEFTKETLVQIVKGVNEANVELKGQNAYVTFRIEKSSTGKSFVDCDNMYIKAIDVDFDVAVTTAETDEATGGGGIQIAQLFLGGVKVSKSSENQSISRIKYSIPLVLGKDYPAK